MKRDRKPKKPASPIGFPIVGIGASAGGLEAVNQLLSKMPKNAGMAFVLVQHLDPKHASMAVEIISRSTKLKVEEVRNGVRLKPRHVYVIPPNRDMKISGGTLRLLPRKSAAGQRMAIDFFFESLAQTMHEKAIGVILSGTGTDGSAGLEAIKSEGGITCVQEPGSAKYDGMPRSAIAAGAADLVLPPEKMAEELLKLAAHLDEAHPKIHAPEHASSKGSLNDIFQLLLSRKKVDFSDYKVSTLVRRIRRRMNVRKTKDLKNYVKYLEENPDEIDALFSEVLINVTEFFRDPEAFKELKSRVFPRLIKNRNTHSPIRIWVPGCSSGEEVYSIAISLLEFQEKSGLKIPIQIFATDISEKSIQTARLGVYPDSIAEKISKERLARFFEKVPGGYKIHKSFRDFCMFSVHDMTRDPPFAKLDLISCRNVLIYFAPELQKRVIPIFHYALNPGGFLFLGKSETPGGYTNLFSSVEKTRKIYLKKNVTTPMKFHFPKLAHVAPPQEKERDAAKTVTDFRSAADKIILSRFTPPGVVVNYDMEILQIRGRVVPFLEPAVGQPSANLFKMARPELLAGLRSLMRSVKKENKAVKKEGIHFETDGVQLIVAINALPLNPHSPLKERDFLVLFRETARLPKKRGATRRKAETDKQSRQIADLLAELSEMKDSHQALVEQYETTQEELTAANEELQSANEELQSTNEEMETAKEELQSTNEELVTVNDELQSRNADLTALGGDLNNLISSTEIPILMVDSNRKIRRFTARAAAVFHLNEGDIGRPIGDIKTDFGLDLDSLLSEFAENPRSKDIEVQDRRNSWYRLQIRPYRTMDNKIDGAILTLIDIDVLKQRVESAKEALAHVIAVAETVPLPLAVVDKDFILQSANRSFYRFFELSDKIVGKDLFGFLNIRSDDLQRLRRLCAQTVEANVPFADFEVETDFPRIGRHNLFLSGGKIRQVDDQPSVLLLGFLDITGRRRLEEERNRLLVQEQEARGEAERSNRAKDVFLATLSHELRTPLSAILSWAQLIRMEKVDAERAKHGAFIIEQSAKAQSRLIDDLLDVSRIISGKLALSIKRTDPAAAIHAAVESVRSMAETKSITISTDLSGESAQISADPIRLQQIIWNLLTNAIKFSPAGGSIEVYLEYRGKPRVARIQVIDHGKGIPPDFLPHLFARFRQADDTSTRVHGGLGLGLSIVRSLTEMQGGTVQAKNAVDAPGSIFTVTFPVSVAAKAKNQANAPETAEALGDEEGATANQNTLRGLRILFVDDDEVTREAIGISLKSYGAEVQLADSAKAALKSLPVFKPDVLVSDIAMPQENGYDLISKVRKLSRDQGGRVPAIALTAYATSQDVELARSAGFQAHLAKPAGPRELNKTILRVIREKRGT